MIPFSPGENFFVRPVLRIYPREAAVAISSRLRAAETIFASSPSLGVKRFKKPNFWRSGNPFFVVRIPLGKAERAAKTLRKAGGMPPRNVGLARDEIYAVRDLRRASTQKGDCIDGKHPFYARARRTRDERARRQGEMGLARVAACRAFAAGPRRSHQGHDRPMEF